MCVFLLFLLYFVVAFGPRCCIVIMLHSYTLSSISIMPFACFHFKLSLCSLVASTRWIEDEYYMCYVNGPADCHERHSLAVHAKLSCDTFPKYDDHFFFLSFRVNYNYCDQLIGDVFACEVNSRNHSRESVYLLYLIDLYVWLCLDRQMCITSKEKIELNWLA